MQGRGRSGTEVGSFQVFAPANLLNGAAVVDLATTPRCAVFTLSPVTTLVRLLKHGYETRQQDHNIHDPLLNLFVV